jgi:hypothetical protein
MDSSSNTPLDSLGEILESAPAFSGQEETPIPLPCLSSGECFFLRVNGQETGPFSVPELQAMIDQGELHKPDRVRQSQSKCWVPCQEIAELIFHKADPAHEHEIEAASSLLNEVLRDAEIPRAASDRSSMEDLPDAEAQDPIENASPFDEPSPKAVATEVKPPRSPSPPRAAPKSLAEAKQLRAAPPAAPSKPVPTEKPKRKPKSGPRFSLPSKPLLLGLGVLILVAAAIRFWPKSSAGMEGHITIDGAPLTVGSLSLTSPGADAKAMSFSIVEGRFHSADQLPDGSYDAVVIVGSPLGLAVVQLENTPFKPLNGAHFKQQVTVKSGAPIQLELSASRAVPMKTTAGVNPLSSH